MPYAAPSLMEEDELKKKEQNGGVNISGESTSFSTGVPGQEASGAKPKTGSGAKFANIQSYLSANQQQGNQMGEKIAGDVSQNADQAIDKTNQFQAAAPKVDAYDPTDAYKNVTSLNDQQKSQYNTAKAGYQGPQQLDQVAGYGDAQSATAKAAGQVQNAKTEEGQRALLKDTYKRPSYSAGENALDQTIMQNSAGSKQGFENLAQKYSGINSIFDTASQSVGNAVNQSKQTGLANQKAINEGEAQAMTGLIDPIKARAAQQTAQNASRIKAVGEDVTDDVLSADTLEMLGLNDGQKLWDMNLGSYLSPDHTEVGVNNAANADERARYAALTALINGQSGNEITADGKAINPVKFNRGQFDSDYAAKTAEMDRIAHATNLGSTQRAGDPDADWAEASGNVNIADYLARGNQAVNVGPGQYLGSGIRIISDSASDAQEAARADLFRQINDWLAQNKYNRAIKKG
jgi:hypothetical protein